MKKQILVVLAALLLTWGASLQAAGLFSKANKRTGEVVLYYTEGDKHSRAFLQEWEKFEQAVMEIDYVRTSRFACEGANRAECGRRGVFLVPTVILYVDGGEQKTFEGQQNAESLRQFVKRNLR